MQDVDRFGNRKSQSAPVLNNVTPSPTTNRLTDSGYAYDAADNMTNDGQNTMVYDGENRVAIAVNGGGSGAYTYDGNSLRVKKCVPNCTSPTTTTVYIFSGSKVIAEYDNGAAVGSPSREYIYSGSALLATISGSSTTYHHADHLSERVATDQNGNVARNYGHYPFGETWYETGTASKLKFTSYERDSESGNDYAMMRYSINRLGRFSSVDPVGGTIGDPQSNNAYTYTENDPINLIDPSGAFMQPSSPWPWPPFPFPGSPFSFFMGQILPCGSPSVANPSGDSIFSDPSSSGINTVSSNCYASGNGLGQGAGGGGQGGRKGVDRNRGGVDTKALDICTRLLFGVALESFTAAQAGPPGTASNGSFIGTMAGIYQGYGRPLAPGPSEFTVVADVSMDQNGVTADWNLHIAFYNLRYGTQIRKAAPGGIAGFTVPLKPFSNYVASNSTDIVGLQIYELGNSLSFISGQQIQSQWGTQYEAGKKLSDCYNFLQRN